MDAVDSLRSNTYEIEMSQRESKAIEDQESSNSSFISILVFKNSRNHF